MSLHSDLYCFLYACMTLIITHICYSLYYLLILLSEGTSYEKIITQLNSELYHVSQWPKANKLNLNTNKTHYMVYLRARHKNNLHI